MNRLLKYILISLCCMLTVPDLYAQVADFDIEGPAAGCAPFETSFKDKSSGAITSWYWDFGDSKSATIPNPFKTYLDPGVYTVKLTVKTATGASSSKSRTVTVYASPKVIFSSTPLSACPCTEINFTNGSLPMAPGSFTSKWSFGDGNIGTGKDARHIYCEPGSYNVALQVTNSFGCTSARIDTGKVIITEKPVVGFSASKTELCLDPDSSLFTPRVSKGKAPYTYDWDFGDGGTSKEETPTHVYHRGVFTVRLIVTDANGCKDTLIRKDLIRSVKPSPAFKLPASICPGDRVLTFDNESVPDALSTTWLWSDGERASGKIAVRNFWEGGNYTVRMISSFAGGCVDTVTKVYTVYPKPRAVFSYAPVYPCPAPVNVTFTNKSRGADSFTWIFGDGTTSRLKNPVHTYTWDSVYTVFLIARSSFGCLDTFRVRDTTKPYPQGYPKPYYDSSNSPVIVRIFSEYMSVKVDTPGGCLGTPAKFSAALFTNTYVPLAGDTARIAKCRILPGYTSPPYRFCFDMPSPDPYPDEFYDPMPVLGGACPYPYPIRRWYWDFGDGTSSTLATPTHMYTAEGSYLVKVTVYTDSCSFTDTIRVERGHMPHAEFSMNPTAICTDNFVTFTNLSTGGLKYYWDFGDSYGSTDSGKYQVHLYKDVIGDRYVVLSAERYGCVDTVQHLLVIYPPGSSFSFRYSCDTPLKVSFKDSSYRATAVLWDFGDGSPRSTLRNPVHTYTSPGTYKVSLMTVNDTFGCRDTLIQTVTVFNPELSFKALDTAVCLKDTVRFVADMKLYHKTLAWYTGTNWQPDSGGRLHFVYLDTGTYTVTLVSEDIHKCLDTFTRKQYILVAKPQIKAVATPQVGCSPISVVFRDLSTDTKGAFISSRKWLFGDASSRTVTADTVHHAYPTGKYTVTLIATDNVGCSDSLYIEVESRRPKVGFRSSVDTISCRGQVVKFTNTSEGVGLKYEWYFGDGGTSAAKDPEYVYKTLGSFTVKLVVTDGTGCKDSLIKEGYIRTTSPRASFEMSDSMALCPPLFVSFTNTSTDAVGRYWNFGNGSTSSVDHPVSPYLDSGIYMVMLVATDKYGCTDTARRRVRMLGYAGSLKYTPLSGCVPLTVDFESELIKADVLIWDFADGITESAVGKPVTRHIYTEPGLYVPQLILGDGKGCASSSRGKDTIRVDGIYPRIVTSPACIGETIYITDSSTSPFSDYAGSEWLLDDGSTSNDRTITRSYTKAGNYSLRLITTNTNGCVDTFYQDLTVHGLPAITAADTVICLGDTAVLAASGGVSYNWQPNATLSCTDCPSPRANPETPDTYYVTGTDEYGCRNTDTVHVGIKTKTRLVLPADTEVCARTPVKLIVAGAHRYSWTPALYLDDANKAAPTATLDTSVTFTVIGREGSCIPDTGKIRVTVYPLPVVNAGEDQRVLAGTMVSLGGSGERVKNYLWSPGDSLDCATCPVASYVARKTAVFMLTGYSDFGCVDSDSVTIVVFCDQGQLYIPNTFTPNGDGQNDMFYPQGKGIGRINVFRIYNRWGQLLFERRQMEVNAREQGWDGSFKGEALGPDVYVYTLEADCDNGEQIFWKGDVTIVK